MNKIGIVFDTTSNLNLEEANKKGVGLIPIVLSVNGKDYKPGIEITQQDLYKVMQDKETNIKTSLPLRKDVEEVFDKMLKKHDQLVFIGLSWKFSGTLDSIKHIAEEEKYKGKIFVYNSLLSAPWTGLLADEIIELFKTEKSIEDAFKKIDLLNPWLVGFMSPESTLWFYKGGRITKLQYMVSNLIKINPILTVIDGMIDQKSVVKSRSVDNAVEKMCEMVKEKVDKLKELKINFKFLSLKSENKIANSKVIEAIKKVFKAKDEDIIETELSTEQTAHLGPGAFGISILVKIKDLAK